MKKLLILALLFVGFAAAQETGGATGEETGGASADTYQVPGFPPYAPAPTMLEVVEDRGDTVLVRHQLGEIEIPKNPQRVYAHADTVSAALFLDLNLVGADDWGEYAELPDFDEVFEGVDVAAAGSSANLERILSLEPDLILAWGNVLYPPSGDPEDAYDQLSEIAPTIVFNANMYSHWQRASLDLADALDLSASAEATLERFEAELESACAPLQENIGDESVIRLSIWGGNLIVHGVGFLDSSGENFVPAGDTVWLYEYCKLQPPENLTDLIPLSSEDGNEQISTEFIPEITADHVFLVSNEEDAEALLSSPLWQAVPAVQNGNAYLIPPVSSYSYELALNAVRLASEAVENAAEESSN